MSSPTDGREFVAQFLISGAGGLHIPLIPDFDGLDEFRVPAVFHSAEWDHSVDLTGKRVAVIGTGASAIQIVPEIVKDVAALQLYQRTPAWVMPRPNNPIPPWMRRMFTYVPGTRAAMRAGIYWIHEAVGFAMTKQPRLLKLGELMGKWNIRRSVKDPELRKKLTPNYRAGCKRILNSDTYYLGIAEPEDRGHHRRHRAVHQAPASSPPTAPSARPTSWCAPPAFMSPTPTPTSTSRAATAKTWSTGGTVRAWPRCAASRSPTCRTCSSCSVPNTALGHNSVVFMIESQIRYAAHAIAAVDKKGAQALAPTRAAQDALQRGAAGRPRRHGLEHRRLPQLVHGRARRQPHAVERDDMAVLAGDPQVRRVRVQAISLARDRHV